MLKITFVEKAKKLAQRESVSARASSQSRRSRPCSSYNAAFVSSINLGISTFARHSSRHILQFTQSFANSRTSSLRSSFSSVICRSTFALARGVAASSPVAKKIGHMRVVVARGRQSPQPLHFAASCVGLSFQISNVCRSGDTTTARSGHAGRLGSGPTILPGFKMFFGSKMRFNSRNTGICGPYCFSTHGVRANPVPCCELIVPLCAIARA